MSVALVRADTLCAWKGSSLLVTTLHGECGAAEPLSGFYCREARVLSTFRIEINGARPWVSEAAATAPDRLDFNFVYPEITQPGGGGTGQAGDEEGIDANGLPERSLDLRLSFIPALDGFEVALAITNRARTRLAAHAFYNPLSYHRGTVWAVEQGTIILGLRRFGFNARALDLTRALFELALLYPEDRIPECVGGYARGDRVTPGAYPRANPTQLWNATAFPLAVQSMLGLVPLASAGTLIVDPILPTWMPEIVVRALCVGRAMVSLRFWRDDNGASKWEVLHTQGTIRVVRQPPPESRSVDVFDRAKGLRESIA